MVQSQQAERMFSKQRFQYVPVPMDFPSASAWGREQWSEFKKEQIEEQRLNVVLEAKGGDTSIESIESIAKDGFFL